jgi:hypothetical protein
MVIGEWRGDLNCPPFPSTYNKNETKAKYLIGDKQ